MAKETATKKKNKKGAKKKSGPDAVAMKVKTDKPNPFESIWSRRKFDILGKRRKGEERRIGLARSRAIDKRNKTLLKEYVQSTKASVFTDKRIGEQNEELGEFDKAIMRSQRERQLKVGKKSKYNLSDEEDEDIGSLGLGSLSENDDFDAGMLSDDDAVDDSEAGGAERKMDVIKHINLQKNLSENNVEEEENRPKSKKEVMEEIILKSKLAKMEKAKQKEENEKLLDELDKSFTAMVQSQMFTSLTQPSKMNALKALVKGSSMEHEKNNEPTTQRSENNKQAQPDSYDKLVYEMAMDIRARPSDRTKTPEEIAQEERERLERLEEERNKRMAATDDLSDEDDEKADKPPIQKPRPISGDDLGDSFVLEEESKRKKGWVDKIFEQREMPESEDDEDDSIQDSEGEDADEDSEGSEEGDEEHGSGLSLKDWEQSDDDDLGAELEDDDQEEDKEEEEEAEEEAKENANNADDEEDVGLKISKKLKNSDGVEVKKGAEDSLVVKQKNENEKLPSNQRDIPFLIDAPKSFNELDALVKGCSNDDVLVVISRIRATNAIRLAAENRKKMQVFYGILLQYFAVLANKKPLNFELLNKLAKPLIEMSMEIPYFAAICARQRLLRMRTQLCEAIKNSENGCWPALKTIFLLRLWSMIFPCSDFRHVVMTPAILLMCEYLMRCPIQCGRDIAIGSFLCSMVLSVTKQSQKFCPEAIIFLRTALMAATCKNPVSHQETEVDNLLELKSVRPLLCISELVDEISPLNFCDVVEMPEDSSFFSSSSFRASVLLTITETLRGFVEVHIKLASFPEIFVPIATLAHEVAKQEEIPKVLREKLKDVALLIEKQCKEHQLHRRPLQMRKQKPVPIKMLKPKFEENFVKGRDYDPDRERAERRKLKKRIKQEAKGAARELRKDNYFLHEVKQRERAQREEERAEKYGKALAFLQEQEHAFKSGQLGKGRKRRR